MGKSNARKEKPHKKEKRSMTAKDQGDNAGDEQRLIRQLAELLNETGLSEIEKIPHLTNKRAVCVRMRP